jgi:hypothetical protein
MPVVAQLVQSLEKVAVPGTLPEADAVGVTNRMRWFAALAVADRYTELNLFRCSGGVV